MRQLHDNVPAARDLRQRMTTAEDALWCALRDRRLGGLKFRRQHPFGPFVLDFCCESRRLVIELDGAVHDEQIEQDHTRTDILTAHGFRVLRFRNEEVLSNLPHVLVQIRAAAEANPVSSPRPPTQQAKPKAPLSPERERGWG